MQLQLANYEIYLPFNSLVGRIFILANTEQLTVGSLSHLKARLQALLVARSKESASDHYSLINSAFACLMNYLVSYRLAGEHKAALNEVVLQLVALATGRFELFLFADFFKFVDNVCMAVNNNQLDIHSCSEAFFEKLSERGRQLVKGCSVGYRRFYSNKLKLLESVIHSARQKTPTKTVSHIGFFVSENPSTS